MLRYLECFRTFFRDAAVRNWEQIGQGHTSDLSINILPVRKVNFHIPRREWEHLSQSPQTSSADVIVTRLYVTP
jgi:hypothetical protein